MRTSSQNKDTRLMKDYKGMHEPPTLLSPPFARHRRAASYIPSIEVNHVPEPLPVYFSPTPFKVKDLAGKELVSLTKLLTPDSRHLRQLSKLDATVQPSTKLRRTSSQPQVKTTEGSLPSANQVLLEKVARLKRLGVDSMLESDGVLKELDGPEKSSHASVISVVEFWGKDKLNDFLVKNDLWDAYKFMQRTAGNKRRHANYHLSKPGKPYKMDENAARRASQAPLNIRGEVSYAALTPSPAEEVDKLPLSVALNKKFQALNSVLTDCDFLHTSTKPYQKACVLALRSVKRVVKHAKPKARPLTNSEKRKYEAYLRIL